MVHLQQSRSARDTSATVLDTTVGTVEAGLAGLEAAARATTADEERELIRRSLAAGGTLDEPSLRLLTEMISELRSSWRMTAAWRGHHDGGDGVEGRGFAVWDCGPLGYWLRELPEEPLPADQVTPGSPFRLVRTDARTVWNRITDLLPDQSELRAAATR
ncbi:hypothetical protein [Streptomyces kanasensis]|nr:hypothetical protein [Streptomyces kanasensis]